MPEPFHPSAMHLEAALLKAWPLIFDQLLDTTQSGIIITDPHQPDNPIVYTNTHFTRITGYTPQESAGKNCRFLQGGERNQAIREDIRTALETRRPFHGLICNQRKNGEYFWNDLSIAPVCDSDHKLLYFVGICNDVSEHIQTQEALQNSNRLLSSIIENIPNMVFLKDAKDLRFQLFNKEAESLLGYSRDQMLGKNDYDFFPTEQADFFTQKDRETLARKIQENIPEEAIDTLHKGRRILHTKKVPILDEQGNPLYLLGISEDITQQKSMEEALKDAKENLEAQVEQRTLELAKINEALTQNLAREKMLRRVVETVSQTFDIQTILDTTTAELVEFFKVDRCLVMLYQTTPETEPDDVRLVSQATRSPDITPVQQKDLPITAWKRFQERQGVPPHYHATPYKMTQKRLSQELEDYLTSYQVQSLLTIEMSYRNVLYGRVTLHDTRTERDWSEEEKILFENIVTHLAVAVYQSELYQQEQVAKQEAENANRRKDIFLASMSHELRTPLNAIIGFSEMLEQGLAGPLNDKQIKYIQNVLASGHHLLQVVNDVLDIAKIEAGKITIESEWVPLQPLLEEVVGILSEVAQKQPVTLLTEVDPTIERVYADPARLKQILYNLIHNAIKFNVPEGNVLIRVSPTPDGQWVTFEIEDTGIGIPAQQMPNLFKEFFQVDTRLARKHEGTGLGLALSKKMVEGHGGEISVTSQVDVGSTFRFTLPHPAT